MTKLDAPHRVGAPREARGGRPASVLTIAGSDSGGGAGIQADLKTFAAYGLHGLSAIAALTAQNTRGVSAVHVPPVAFLRAQLDACFEDFAIAAVKIGMLANARVIDAVADELERRRPRFSIVLDPVMVASSGATLLDPRALDALRRRLLPLATVVTPNIPEAELLLGHGIADGAAAEAAVVELLGLGAPAVLLKGGHLPGRDVVDRLDDGQQLHEFVHRRLRVEGHGTGCTLASAIATSLALGKTLPEACADAADYVHGALLGATRPGKGRVCVLDHFWRIRPCA
jgi:hydroxymethylpyrimidine/phosphomethylpyrimidine kinase